MAFHLKGMSSQDAFTNVYVIVFVCMEIAFPICIGKVLFRKQSPSSLINSHTLDRDNIPKAMPCLGSFDGCSRYPLWSYFNAFKK